MIKIENYEVVGWEHAIRGMRNPMNSWDRSDSGFCDIIGDNFGDIIKPENYRVGPNDYDLMKRLASGGSDDRKFMRMITVYLDVTAPLYWWKEFDTYKVGTVANSCSTMHKIHAKEFTLDDFSHEHLVGESETALKAIVDQLNFARIAYLETKDKDYWWEMIQLLPTSYNQKRTVMLNYEVLKNIYHARKNHKLTEWQDLCSWIETLPYAKGLIYVEENA